MISSFMQRSQKSPTPVQPLSSVQVAPLLRHLPVVQSLSSVHGVARSPRQAPALATEPLWSASTMKTLAAFEPAPDPMPVSNEIGVASDEWNSSKIESRPVGGAHTPLGTPQSASRV